MKKRNTKKETATKETNTPTKTKKRKERSLDTAEKDRVKKKVKAKAKKIKVETGSEPEEIVAPQVGPPVVLQRRGSARLLARHDVALKPTLTFTSRYTGAGHQELDEVQDIKFEQRAVLEMTDKAPHAIDHYYELRQEVRDTFTDATGHTVARREFEQDGPYEPPYKGASGVITATKNAIEFYDVPGFGGTSAIEAGKWVTSYDVYFQWTVTDMNGNSRTSPEVHHQMRSPYNGGAGVPVTAVAAADMTWTVDLPDRPAD